MSKDDPHRDYDWAPEFSRIVSVDELGAEPRVFAFEASKGERDALADRFGVDGLDSLAGEAELRLLSSGDVAMTVWAKARVRQTCVVTLAPIKTDINIDFTTSYSEEADASWDRGEALNEDDFDDDFPEIEPSEPLIEGKIDIGEAVSEQLALEIDPFPRVKGATFDGYSTDTRGEPAPGEAKPNPFAALSKLKSRQENEK